MFAVREIISNQARPEDNTQIHTGGKPYECLQCGNRFYVNFHERMQTLWREVT